MKSKCAAGAYTAMVTARSPAAGNIVASNPGVDRVVSTARGMGVPPHWRAAGEGLAMVAATPRVIGRSTAGMRAARLAKSGSRADAENHECRRDDGGGDEEHHTVPGALGDVPERERPGRRAEVERAVVEGLGPAELLDREPFDRERVERRVDDALGRPEQQSRAGEPE